MAMGQIEKQFGKGSVMKLGEQGAPQMDAVSTGCLDLDIALGLVEYQKEELLRYMDQRVLVKQQWLYM